MNANLFNSFKKKHPVLTNFVLIVIVFAAGCYASLMLLDVFTSHGQEVKVPDVRYKPINEAISLLEDADLTYQIDSIYNEDYRPGVVIDQTPTPGLMVKKVRIVQLTINMIFPPEIQLPKELTDMAGSDGVTLLKSLGFRNVKTDTIPSDKRGLIIDITVNGHKVALGTKARVNSGIVLSVGDGKMDIQEYDPLGDAQRDSLLQEQIRRGTIRVENDSFEDTDY